MKLPACYTATHRYAYRYLKQFNLTKNPLKFKIKYDRPTKSGSLEFSRPAEADEKYEMLSIILVKAAGNRRWLESILCGKLGMTPSFKLRC